MSRLNDMGREVLEKEARSILEVRERLDDAFDRAVEAIDGCRGRVVFSGMGKAGLIAKKIASTFSSIGIPSLYLHPAESVHGDLGIVQKEDLFFVISNSGETDEVIKILPWIKRMGLRSIVVTGNASSTIAGFGDIVLDIKVEEACPYNIIPTSSTTRALALGRCNCRGPYEGEGFQRGKTWPCSIRGEPSAGAFFSGWKTSCTPGRPCPGSTRTCS